MITKKEVKLAIKGQPAKFMDVVRGRLSEKVETEVEYLNMNLANSVFGKKRHETTR